MIPTEQEPFAALAELLTYPDARFPQRVQQCLRQVESGPLEVQSALREFAAATSLLSDTEREELYARTFDINPAAALEIGWHLFGEEYHRGALLVRLRQELRRHGIEETTELPDHLMHVLPLVGRMNAAEAAAFARSCVIPAVTKMCEGLTNKDNPYEALLRATAALLRDRFAVPDVETSHVHRTGLS